MNKPKNKPVRLSAIAGLVLFAFPLAKQAIAAQIDANAGNIITQADFTHDGSSSVGLLSNGAGAEINITGTGTFNLNSDQSGFQSKNGGAINLTGGGTINVANGAGTTPLATVTEANSKLTIKDYLITVDSSSSTTGKHVFDLTRTLADNQISNTTVNYKGSDTQSLMDVSASNITLTNSRFIADHAKGGAVTILSNNGVISNVNINGGYYESSNSLDDFNSSPLSGATLDLGGGSNLNLTNNVQVISTDANAIQLRNGTLNSQNAQITGVTAGILSSISGGDANLSNTTVTASQGSAIFINSHTYNNKTPFIGLNAVNSSLSGNHGIRVEKSGLITGSLDNTKINAVDTAISVDYMNVNNGYIGSVLLDVKNGSVLKAANVFDAQNGGSLDLTLDGSTATGSSHLIYSKDSSVSLNATASNLTGDMEQSGTGNVDVVLAGASSLKGAAININQLSLADNSAWEITNNSSVTTLDNSGGTITFATPSTAFHTLNVLGNYTGGGNLVLNTKLGDDASLTDKLVVAGDTSGTTKVKVNNIGGSGAQTIRGIEVIEVQGASNGTFEQDGRIVAGAYDYSLMRGDVADGNSDQNWYLSAQYVADPGGSTGNNGNNTGSGTGTGKVFAIRPEAGSYLGLIEHNQSTFNHSFHDRQQLLDNQYQSAWARVEYTKAESKAGNGQLDNETERTLLHFGADVLQQDKLHMGLMGGYARGDVDTSSNAKGKVDTSSHLSSKNSSAKSDGYSFGVYGTWFDQDKDNGGLYVDTYAQYNWFDNKVNGQGLAEESFDTDGYTLSAEAGYGFALGKMGNMTWQVEPQVQILYNSYNGKDHTEKNGTRISTNDSDDFVSRVGVRFQGKSETIEPFITLNYWNHSQNAGISMGDAQVESERARNIFEVKAGGQISLNKNVDLFAQVSSSWGDNSTSSYGGNIGLQMKW